MSGTVVPTSSPPHPADHENQLSHLGLQAREGILVLACEHEVADIMHCLHLTSADSARMARGRIIGNTQLCSSVENVPHLDDKLFLVHNLHAQRKEVAGLGIVVTGCIIALQGILVEELLDIVLIGNGEVGSRIVDQGISNAIPICCVVPVPCMS